jgi:PAS domain S-box-containing protein
MPKKIFTTLGFIFERSLPWLVLAILVTYTYAKFFVAPYPGFELSNGTVRLVLTANPDDQLVAEDQLLKVGPVDMAEFAADPKMLLFENVQVGDTVPILIERDGQVNSIDWEYVGQNRAALLENLNGLWWLPYVFWLAGTATLLFIRPRDLRWKLLIAFNYLTAIWFVAGGGPSTWHIWFSMFVLRSGVWLCVPIYLHFHWVYPKPLKQLPKVVWGLLYCASLLLAAAEWLNLLPLSTYFTGFLLSLVGSLVLLVLHFIFQPEQRANLRLLLLAVGIILIPPIVIGLFEFLGIKLPPTLAGGSLLAFPALPGAYFITSIRDQFPYLNDRIRQFIRNYVIAIILTTLLIIGLAVFVFQFKWQDSSLGLGMLIIPILAVLAIFSLLPFFAIPALAESIYQPHAGADQLHLRANRLLAAFTFLILVGAGLALGLIILFSFAENDISKIMSGVFAIIGAILLSVNGYPGYRRFVDRRILGIKLPPTDLIETYAERITTSLNQTDLTKLLQEEILPSLLIRQAALIPIKNGENVTPLLSRGVTEAQITAELAAPNTLDSWVKVDLPLTIHGREIGRLLLGAKDPDDIYSQGEVAVLRAIANQTAVALHNIDQNERLQSIYQSNIERHEDERKQLAHDFHDEVLNGLASLLMFVDLDTAAPNYLTEHKALTTRIRRMISGLRPAQLDDGLWAALNALADELRTRVSGLVGIHFEIPTTEQRYETSVEGHLYRIVQQACDNALQHAEAKNIIISGKLLPDQVRLQIQDDGQGFDPEERSNDSVKNRVKHYGLSVMGDRAKAIGADFQLASHPGEGTQIQIEFTDILRRTEERVARIDAEKSLQARELNFQSLVNNATYGILMADKTQNIIYANHQAVEITGYTIAELTKLNITDLASRSGYEKLDNWSSIWFQDKPVRTQIETAICHQDGNEIPIEMMIADTLWKGESVSMTLFRDITRQKNIQKELQEAETNFQLIVENANDGILVASADNKYVYANQHLAAMLDYSVTEILALKFEELLHPDYSDQIINRFRERISEKKVSSQYEIKFLKKDGTPLEAEVTAALTTWQGQPASIGVIRDISARKLTQLKIQKSEENLRKIFEQAHDAIIIADGDQNHLFVNQHLADITGYEMPELYQIKTAQLIHPNELQGFYQRIQNRLGGKPTHEKYEITVVAKDGREIPVEISGNLIEWHGKPAGLGILRDISERKAAEELRQKNEREMRKIMDSANDGILIAHTDETHLYANDKIATQTGYSKDELLQLTASDLIHPDEHPAFQKRRKNRITGEIPHETYQTVLRHKNGDPIPVEVSGNRIDWRGQTATLGLFRDISDRARIEDDHLIFATIFANSPEAISITLPNGNMVYNNPTHEKLFNLSAKEIRGQNYHDFYQPEYIAIIDTLIIPELSKKGSWEGQLEILGTDGKLIPVSKRVVIVRDVHQKTRYAFSLVRQLSPDQT